MLLIKFFFRLHILFSTHQNEQSPDFLSILFGGHRKMCYFCTAIGKIKSHFFLLFGLLSKINGTHYPEDWQSDRMRWTRNPVYPFPGIGGLNPSSSATQDDFLFTTSPLCPAWWGFFVIILFRRNVSYVSFNTAFSPVPAASTSGW